MEEQPQKIQDYDSNLTTDHISNFNKPKSFWIVVSIVIFIGLIATFYFIFTSDSENNSETIIAEDGDTEYTLSEIIEQGKEKGLEFCNELGREDLKKDCIESYLLNKAKKEINASICKESDNEIFVQQCQYNAILPEVAKKYNEEVITQNNTEIIPSNINLCDQLDDEELKALCLNPKKAIEEDYHLLD